MRPASVETPGARSTRRSKRIGADFHRLMRANLRGGRRPAVDAEAVLHLHRLVETLCAAARSGVRARVLAQIPAAAERA